MTRRIVVGCVLVCVLLACDLITLSPTPTLPATLFSVTPSNAMPLGRAVSSQTLTPTVTLTRPATRTALPTEITFTPSLVLSDSLTVTLSVTATLVLDLAPALTDTPSPTFTLLPALTPSPTAIPILHPEACVPSDTLADYGLVKWVSDGDIIIVEIGGRLRSVRYIGIDAPADVPHVEYLGAQATARNRALVLDQFVRLVRDVSDTDEFGQLLRYVFVKDLFINFELVRQGLARSTVLSPDLACADIFNQAQELAKQELRGIWMALTFSPTPTITKMVWTPHPSRTLTPTRTPGGVCDCSGNIYRCHDFDTRAEAQACYDFCKRLGKGDIHRLDHNGDGKACNE